MAKKYHISEEQSLNVSEHVAAYSYNESPTVKPVVLHTDRSNVNTAISGEELKLRLSESLKSRFL